MQAGESGGQARVGKAQRAAGAQQHDFGRFFQQGFEMGGFQVLETADRPWLDVAFGHHEHRRFVPDRIDFYIAGTVAGHGIEALGLVGVEFQVGASCRRDVSGEPPGAEGWPKQETGDGLVAGSCAREGKTLAAMQESVPKSVIIRYLIAFASRSATPREPHCGRAARRAGQSRDSQIPLPPETGSLP